MDTGSVMEIGIASAPAPAIFQRTMETVLQGLLGVHVYLDNILVTGASEISLAEIGGCWFVAKVK